MCKKIYMCIIPLFRARVFRFPGSVIPLSLYYRYSVPLIRKVIPLFRVPVNRSETTRFEENEIRIIYKRVKSLWKKTMLVKRKKFEKQHIVVVQYFNAAPECSVGR